MVVQNGTEQNRRTPRSNGVELKLDATFRKHTNFLRVRSLVRLITLQVAGERTPRQCVPSWLVGAGVVTMMHLIIE